jgi:hypothetical protein
VHLGMTKDEMLDLSIPEMVDVIDYFQEMRRGR